MSIEFLAAYGALQSTDPDLEMDVLPINTVGVGLSVVAAALIGVLAWTVQLISTSASSKLPDEGTKLKLQEDAETENDSDKVGLVAIGGSAALLGLNTLIGWYSGQLAPLAATAVGISIFFTLRPVRVRCRYVPQGAILFDMASAPWLCIGWQVFCTAMPPRILVWGILGEPGGILKPWTMLVTFVGAVYLCISLETTGGMVACAHALARAFGKSPSALFLCFASMASCLTVLIPDDVVTMTLAPTICLLTLSLGLNPEPHLYAQFYCANIFAATLITGNITNVLIAEVTGDRFLSFAKTMVLPGVVAGLSALTALYMVSRPALAEPPRPIASTGPEALANPTEVRYPIRCIVAALRLAFTFTFAAFDEWHKWPIWMTLAVFAAASVFMDLLFDACRAEGSNTHFFETMKALPYDVFFFFPALFILVQQLVHVGAITFLAHHIESIALMPVTAMVAVGFMSVWTAQVLSTAPMTILFLSVIIHVPSWKNPATGSDAQAARNLALYALVMGSNFCGNVTRIGTMGGQMWFKIARSHGIHLSEGKMVLRGVYIMMPVNLLALAVLYVSYHLFQ